MVGASRVKTATASVWFMRFQHKKPEKRRKNLFRNKQRTSKTPLMFFDLKMFRER